MRYYPRNHVADIYFVSNNFIKIAIRILKNSENEKSPRYIECALYAKKIAGRQYTIWRLRN